MKKLLLLFALLCASAFGQVHSDIATQNTQGNWVKAIPEAQVYLCDIATTDLACLVGTGTVQLYTDKTLSTTTTQPVIADSDGNYTLYANPGIYKQCVKGVTTFCQIIEVPSVNTTIVPSVTCPGALPGSLAAWTTPTDLSCDPHSITDFLGNLQSQSYQAVGPHNGEVWLTTDGVVSASTLPAGTVGLVVPNVVTTPFRVNVPPAPCADGQVWQQLSHSTDASGTYNSFLNCLTPVSGGTSNFVYEIPAGTVNGSNVTFTLSQTPNPSSTLMLWRNGQLQGGGIDYTLSTATITFSVAPITSDTLYAFYGAGATVAGNAVLSVFGRTGAVVAATNDYSVGQVTNAAKVQTCTNKLLSAVDSAATAGNCHTVTTTDTDTTIAKTGTDINTSNQVTVTHLAAALPVAQGGTGDTTAQGNGSKVQLSTGTTTTNNCVKFDANGNTVDSGGACGAGGSGALTKLCTLTASSSASLDFLSANCTTSPFSSTYDEYLISVKNITPATNGSALQMRMSTNGTSCDSGSSPGYGSVNFFWYTGGTGNVAGSASTGLNAMFVGDDHTSSTASNGGLSSALHLFTPASATNNKNITGTTFNYNNAVPAPVGTTVLGSYNTTTAVLGFCLFFNSGNIASGSVSVYGVQK